MHADDMMAVWLPSGNFDAGRGGVVVDRIVLHTTEGAYDGAVAWLRGARGGTSNRESSAHYVVSADGGRVAQLVREADTAWHAGVYAFNQRSIGIEQEGYAGRGGFADGLYTSVAALVARLAARHGVPLDRQHVLGHGEVPGQDHWDPGAAYDWERLLALARAAAVATSADPNARYFPETHLWVVNLPQAPLLTFWAQGGVERYGYPLAGMIRRPDGVFEQLFENCLLESWPHGFGRYPGPHVRLGGLGQRYHLLARSQASSAREAGVR